MKWTLAAVSVVALMGVGLAAAQTPEGQAATASLRDKLRFARNHPIAAIDKVCDDNVTWGDCKELLKEKRDDIRAQIQQKVDERYQQCLQTHDESYCDGRLDQFKHDHPRVYGNETADPASA